jgi:hypothetical protein
MKRRIEITVEAERTIASIGGRSDQWTQWCSACVTTVTFATAEKASIACAVSTRLIYRRIEEGRVHFIESNRGLAVCLPSLLNSVEL